MATSSSILLISAAYGELVLKGSGVAVTVVGSVWVLSVVVVVLSVCPGLQAYNVANKSKKAKIDFIVYFMVLIIKNKNCGRRDKIPTTAVFYIN